jgi:hypothetical protein
MALSRFAFTAAPARAHRLSLSGDGRLGWVWCVAGWRGRAHAVDALLAVAALPGLEPLDRLEGGPMVAALL